jgi:predicted N-formylglutamate amidohydrolase
LNDSRADPVPSSNRLLGPGDPSPVIVTNPSGFSPFLLLGDHAGRAIPRRLGDLGLPPGALDRHIAWDIGVEGLGLRLSTELDACFIRQTYSRLVIDCNRRPGEADSIPTASDSVAIPGNLGLGSADIAARVNDVWRPYQDGVARLLEERQGLGRETRLVSLHSFTPKMGGESRPWRYGVLHRGDSALSARMLALLRAEFGDQAGDNQPYAMDGTDATIPLHADPRGLDYLELEVRQDLIEDDDGQDAAAAVITRLLRSA